MNPVRFHLKAATHHLAEALNENEGEIPDAHKWQVLNAKQDLQLLRPRLNDYHGTGEDDHE